jgi:hypothetical protein
MVNEVTIGTADEWAVTLNVETCQVEILDGEQVVRLSMNEDHWNSLCFQTRERQWEEMWAAAAAAAAARKERGFCPSPDP